MISKTDVDTTTTTSPTNTVPVESSTSASSTSSEDPEKPAVTTTPQEATHNPGNATELTRKLIDTKQNIAAQFHCGPAEELRGGPLDVQKATDQAVQWCIAKNGTLINDKALRQPTAFAVDTNHDLGVVMREQCKEEDNIPLFSADCGVAFVKLLGECPTDQWKGARFMVNCMKFTISNLTLEAEAAARGDPFPIAGDIG